MYNGVDLKQRQIETLHRAATTGGFRLVTLAPNSRYIAEFTAARNQLKLVIALPHNFPNVPPIISLAPHTFTHPWVQPRTGTITGCDELSKWCTTSVLGSVVGKIVSHFLRNPPRDGSANTSDSFSRSSHHSVHSHHSPSPSPHGSFSIATSDTATSSSSLHDGSESLLPPPPPIHEILAALSNDELTALVESDDALAKFVEEHVYVKTTSDIVAAKGRDVLSAAEANLNMKPELERKKATLKQLAEEVAQLSSEVAQETHKLNEVAEMFLPENVVDQLHIGIEEAESKAHAFVRNFMNEELGDRDFIKQYRKAKKLEHARRIKASLYQKTM